MPLQLSVNNLSFWPLSNIVWTHTERSIVEVSVFSQPRLPGREREEGPAKQTSITVAVLKSYELDFRTTWLPHGSVLVKTIEHQIPSVKQTLRKNSMAPPNRVFTVEFKVHHLQYITKWLCISSIADRPRESSSYKGIMLPAVFYVASKAGMVWMV